MVSDIGVLCNAHLGTCPVLVFDLKNPSFPGFQKRRVQQLGVGGVGESGYHNGSDGYVSLLG